MLHLDTKTFLILLISFLVITLSSLHLHQANATFNLTLPHQHPRPEEVVQDLHRRVDTSLSKWLARDQLTSSCTTGNPIDDCWRCDPDWATTNRQRLADCAIGFGRNALGGKGGPIYVVTDSSDDSDPNNPKPGTLRDAVSRLGPVWIIFSANMLITLKSPLMVTSYKTIDGRGANVQITGGGCISIQQVTNVIIHNINIHHCVPANSDGDGLHVFSASAVWIDHCTISNCADGLIDCTVGSTAITISNNYFFNHDKVMLLGHSDAYTADKGMQVTVAFNRFGPNLNQRMPRCRFGYFHVVNNDYTGWREYAIGGSASPTINSQGNRYMAPGNEDAKEVTMRMDAGTNEWQTWNWRTEGDQMLNGAFFVPSGDGLNSAVYAMASSLSPKSASYIDQLTMNTGAMIPNEESSAGITNPTSAGGGEGGTYSGQGGGNGDSTGSNGYYGIIFGSRACPPPSSYKIHVIFSALLFFPHFV